MPDAIDVKIPGIGSADGIKQSYSSSYPSNLSFYTSASAQTTLRRYLLERNRFVEESFVGVFNFL